ncbi:hypothetical protein F4781DRAFT_369305 [Annulohypoxylon bovei var. microspora]|nr:hypothetical protein F4781DRAFT_369305 [Annulohypoxylon bovei var. microspora]
MRDWQVPESSESKMDGLGDLMGSRFGVQVENNERRESVVDLDDDDVQDVEMEDSPMTMTPEGQTVMAPSTLGSRTFARPVTRSISKLSSAEPLEAMSYTTTSLRARLQTSSKKPMIPTLNLSKLEESKDIKYCNERRVNEQDGERDEDEVIVGSETKDEDSSLISPSLLKLLRKHPDIGQLRMPLRRSARIGDHQAPTNDPVASTSTTLSKTRARRVGGRRTRANRAKAYPRRSPRLWKPLTEFHQYVRLPPELKMMIWEAAIEPRLLYICNRSSISHAGATFGAQNRPPTWFNTCHLSRWIAQLHYQKRFGLHDPLVPALGPKTIQDTNTNDIVTFEPCHGACRGCHCARHQYCEADRSAVRFLAVQTESPHLPVTTEPCWQTITRSWPNVETLYLMRIAVRGVDKREKAMIRVRANNHEVALLRRFDQWKRNEGKDVKVNRLEFVQIVQKENGTGNPKDQYRSVNDRLTGFPEDIILG